MIVQQLIRQHQDIGSILGELKQKISSQEEVKKNSMHIALKVSRLSGILKIHLRSEDNNLYPALLKDEDPKVREIAKRFFAEMGDLAKIFEQYKAKYAKKAIIEQQVNNFIKDTKQIINAISKQVENEETKLYKLLS